MGTHLPRDRLQGAVRCPHPGACRSVGLVFTVATAGGMVWRLSRTSLFWMDRHNLQRIDMDAPLGKERRHVGPFILSLLATVISGFLKVPGMGYAARQASYRNWRFAHGSLQVLSWR